MIDREPLTAPGGTLFLVGPDDVLLTTLDGGEATVPLGDLAMLFERLFAAGTKEGAPLRLKIVQGS